MTETYNVIDRDGRILQGLDREQILLMVDQGTLTPASRVQAVGAEAWSIVKDQFEASLLAAPPRPAPPLPKPPQALAPGMEPRTRERFGSMDVLINLACGAVLAGLTMAFNDWTVRGDGANLAGGFLGLTFVYAVAVAVVFWPMRIACRRLTSALTAGGSLFLILVLVQVGTRVKAFQRARAEAQAKADLERRLNATVALVPRRASDLVELPTPSPFRTDTLPVTAASPVAFGRSFTAQHGRLTVEVFEYNYKPFYYFVPEMALKAVEADLARRAEAGTEKITAPTACKVDGAPAWQGSISLHPRGEAPGALTLYKVIAFGIRKGDPHPTTGVMVAVTASYPDAARNDLEVERVAASITRLK